ncbi:hypothetical protein DMUE_5837, partial [Dictyocoela muelleri]
NNLDLHVKLELTKQPITDIRETISTITRIENVLIENISIQIQEKHMMNTKYHHHQAKINHNQFSKNHNFTNTKKEWKNKKFCRYHKTHTHNDEECRALYKKSKRNAEPDKKQNYAIHERIPKIKNIETDITVEGKNFSAIIDTGACDNFVSESLSEGLNIETKVLTTPREIELADGSKRTISKETSISFQLFGDTNTTYTSKFLILPRTATTMILGMPFLSENKCVINLD